MVLELGGNSFQFIFEEINEGAPLMTPGFVIFTQILVNPHKRKKKQTG